ncbi:hypothetical protein LCGC14_2917810 [marine sediment metagenome]|uniref:Uncharacterized protein n=1 Tax=marine sediment metagenome TaxID=412755 RepID=A0A0F8XQ04_9ZZZZ
MSDVVNFDMGPWPTDPAKQVLFMGQLTNRLVQMDTYLRGKTADIILLEQAGEPTQEEWEIAWLTQADKPLPISKGAVFYWWDTVSNSLAGCYGILLDAIDVIRKDPKYVRSGIVIKDETSLSTAVSTSDPIGTVLENHPLIAFTNNQIIQLELVYELWVQLDSGTGLWGADFLLDGVKQGTAIHSVSADQGIFSTAVSGLVRAFMTVANVEPGTHIVQAMLGIVGTDGNPPTIEYGGIENVAGNYGLRTLSVKGYAL